MTYPVSSSSGTHLRALVLCTLAAAALAVAGTGKPAVAAEGDRLALGRYLAAECNACHGSAKQGAAIPVIAGRPEAELVATLKAYASGSLPGGRRANPAMVSVAQSLDDAQMAAVAAYVATLPVGR